MKTLCLNHNHFAKLDAIATKLKQVTTPQKQITKSRSGESIVYHRCERCTGSCSGSCSGYCRGLVL